MRRIPSLVKVASLIKDGCRKEGERRTKLFTDRVTDATNCGDRTLLLILTIKSHPKYASFQMPAHSLALRKPMAANTACHIFPAL